jgi:hypothetical protein
MRKKLPKLLKVMKMDSRYFAEMVLQFCGQCGHSWQELIVRIAANLKEIILQEAYLEKGERKKDLFDSFMNAVWHY